MSRRSWFVAAVLVAALVARLAYVLLAPLPPISGDAAGYDAAAQRLVATGTYAYPVVAYAATGRITGDAYAEFARMRPNAYTMPGYTLFLAAIWRVVPDAEARLTAARVAQALLGALSLLLLYLLVRRVLDEKAAAIALVAAAIYPPFVWATGELLTETLYAFVLLAFLLAVVAALESARLRDFALAGALLGVSTLIRPLAVVWVALVVLYMMVSKRFTWGKTALATAVLGLALVAVMSPWWARNAVRYGSFIPLTTCGANPLAASTSPSYLAGGRPEVDYPPDLLDDDLALGRYWRNVADAQIAYIVKHDPWAYVRIKLLNARFAVIHFWPEEPAGALNTALARRYSRLMLYLFYALGLFGIWAQRRNGKLLLIASLPLYFIAAHLLTLFLNRYLYPAMWVWVVPAAAGVAAVWEFAAKRFAGRRPVSA
ncbi:MAG TPA: glycosyltransferase family 39 protein [Coriobacteriia bacterium]